MEGGRHGHVHRHVVLDPDRPAVEGRLAAISGGLGDGDIEIARDGAPRGAMILEGDGSPVRPHVRHRCDKAPGTASAAHVELRKAVDAPGPLLDHHVPVDHLDRVEQHFAPQHRIPPQRQVDASGADERAMLWRHSLDHEILEHERAGEQMHAQPPDVHLPADSRGSLAFGEAAERRAEIDREGGHDRGRQHGCTHQHADPGEPENEVRPYAFETLEPERH
jgi:hypothetical protein